MRIAHLADLHFRKDFYAEIKASIDTVITEHHCLPFDLIMVCGDTWDGPVQNTAGSMFAAFLDLIRKLADCAPVAMIYGTPSHDADGSLEVFEQIEAKYPIVILRPGSAYGLIRTGENFGSINEFDQKTHEMCGYDALLLGVPEPNKKWLLANQEATGKDASDEALRGLMRAMLLGLGGIRKQHQDLPCLLLYHGQVSGARTGTGYTAGSGIAVSKDDLAAVGADYIAMGDIHLPQQIPGIPAYYPGKIYTGDWKEVGYKPGCNVVEITRGSDPEDLFGAGPDQNNITVSRLDFPHAQRVKIARTPGDSIKYDDLSLEGKIVWEEWTAPDRSWADNFDTASELDGLLSIGALEGSIVTLNVLPTETVRAAEIAEKKTLEDKLQVYAENSGITITDGVKQKARELEREAKARGAVEGGAHIRINRLVLRGAIGIWKNQGKDEIVLNLDAYGPGVIAVVGGNGAGKTTILENLHPWPQMLTRGGALKDHFRLKDSVRDLYFTDERTGTRYRAEILIRADIASGGIECWLFQETAQGWEPLPGINGRQDPYLEAIASLFGSMEMYLRTAFQTQRPTSTAPDLSETTKGQRKAMFAELSGIDYLDAYREEAKARGDSIEAELVRIQAAIDAAADVDETIARLSGEAAAADEQAAARAAEAKSIDASIQTAKAEREALGLRVAEFDRKAARRQEVERELARLLEEVQEAEREIAGFRGATSGRAAAEAEVHRIESLIAERDRLRAEKAEIDAANTAALVKHQDALREIEGRRRTAQAALDAARGRKAAADREAAVARARLAAPIADHCPTCAQLLPEEKRKHLQEERAKLESQIQALADAINAAQHDEMTADLALSEIVAPPAPVASPFPAAERLSMVEADISFTDIAAEREIVRKANEAAVRIEAAEKAKAEKAGRIQQLQTERDSVAGDAEAERWARSALAAKDEELETRRRAHTAATSAAAAARASADAARRAIADAEKRRQAREAAEKERGARGDELMDWRVLERAVGPDGIQALELDALAPSIAAVANRLLAVQSPRYGVEFRTTRIAGKGGKTKQVETFEIYVLDSETGTEQEIGTLSGGEGVWIKRAIYDAFAAIRAQNTGVQFLTVMQDETDGALDPEARMAYLRMLEAAHKESGRHQTLLITHSTELQAMVGQTIDVWSLEGRKSEEVAA